MRTIVLDLFPRSRERAILLYDLKRSNKVEFTKENACLEKNSFLLFVFFLFPVSFFLFSGLEKKKSLVFNSF